MSKRNHWKKQLPYALGICAVCLIVGFLKNNYVILVLNTALIYAITAYGLSVMLGMSGQLVFSGTAFMGIGAYVVGNLCSGRLNVMWPTFPALLLGVVVSTVIAFLTGILFLRLKNVFCTFATMGFVQVCFSLFQQYEPLFGGPKGVSQIATLNLFGWKLESFKEWFFALLGFTVIVAIVVERVRSSRLGRSLALIRDNELAAQTMGVNIYWTRVIAFMLSAAFAGLSGGLIAMHNNFISGDLFTFAKSTTIVIMSMLGGINSTLGILLGAFICTCLPEMMRGLDHYLMFIYGFLIIIMMIFMPMGLGGLISDFFKQRRRKARKAAMERGTNT